MPYSDLVRAAAEGRYADLVSRAPREVLGTANDDRVFALWGLGLMQLKRIGEAVAVYRVATTRFPGQARNWSNLGTALRENGDLLGARKAYAAALLADPSNAQLLANAAYVELDRGRSRTASALLLRALQCDPSDLGVRVYAAKACVECGRDDEAWAIVANHAEWDARVPPHVRLELACLLVYLGEAQHGVKLLNSHWEDLAVEVVAQARLVMVLERLNRVDEARCIMKQLPLPESIADANVRREVSDAQVVMDARGGNFGRARRTLEARIPRERSPRWRMSALFMLARVCDAQGNYRACARNLQRAHALQAATLETPGQGDSCGAGVTSDKDPRTDEPSKREDIARLTTHRVSDPSVPIFIVGFPRSGTTLLEQILNAHPLLHSIGEQAAVQSAIDALAAAGITYPDGVAHMTPSETTAAREQYWAYAAHVTTVPKNCRLIDKNPMNMTRLPIIMRMFPESPIILAIRHPYDVVLSCYMQSFRDNQFASMSATLDRLVCGYVRAMDSWLHYSELLHPTCLIWRYEDVIADFKSSIRELASFLRLENPSFLYNYRKHVSEVGYIQTPSYDQVTQPLYQRSVNRWVHYIDLLRPAVNDLRPMVEYWGYATSA